MSRLRTPVFIGLVAGVFASLAATAAHADPWSLSGSNYNPPCNDISVPYMSCVQGGGGQVIVLTGSSLTGCTEIIQMGFGWTGNLPVTVNGAGTQMQFTVPNDASFQGWALFNCGFQPSAFLFQSPSYPPLAVDVTVTVDALPDAVVGDSVPTPTYTTDPATTAADWTTLPTCGVFDPAAPGTPLTQLLSAGTFDTRCSGGVKADGGLVTYVDGSLVVTEDPSGGGSGEAESGPPADADLPNTGLSALGASILALLGATLVILAAAARSGQSQLRFAGQHARLSLVLRRLHMTLRRLERRR